MCTLLITRTEGMFKTQQSDFEEIYRSVLKFYHAHPAYHWGSKTHPAVGHTAASPWEPYDRLALMTKSRSMEAMVVWRPTFHYEQGSSLALTGPVPLIHNTLAYTSVFCLEDHIHMVGRHPDLGYVVISIERSKLAHRRCLVWHSLGQKQLTLAPHIEASKETLYEIFFQTFARVPREVTLTTVMGHEFSHKLKEMESKDYCFKFKIGVLCATKSTAEMDLYEEDTITPLFLEFIESFSQRVSLKDWKGFSGGLDVSGDAATGAESYYTCFARNEVMFHVGPLIPKGSEDPARKRHIGNDIIVVVFKECSQKFDPSDFKSKFNHLWIVVEKATQGQEGYRVEVVSKIELPPIQPFLNPAKFIPKWDFRDWLLTKVINAERTILQSVPIFSLRNEMLRKSLLHDLCSPYIQED